MGYAQRTLVNIFASTLGLLLLSLLTDHLQKNGLSAIASFAIGGAVFAVTSVIVLFYAPVLRSIPLIRDLYHQKKFEGLWVSAVDIKNRPYALASIYFDSGRRTWVYRGTAFSADLKPAAKWKSFSVTFTEGNRWIFHGGASRLVTNDGIRYKQFEPPGHALTLMTLPDHNVSEFEALVTDLGIDGDNPMSFRVFLRRLDPLIMQEVLGQKRAPHIEDITFADAAKILQLHIDRTKLPIQYDSDSGPDPE